MAMYTWLCSPPERTRSTLDFLLPDISLVGNDMNGHNIFKTVTTPMEYMKTLTMFRKGLCRVNVFLGTCVASTALAAAAYALHFKATLLTIAKQLDEEERHCADHGHHRVPSGQTSVRLDSRDDVWGALTLHGNIICTFATG